MRAVLEPADLRRYDELNDANGGMRAHWRPLIERLRDKRAALAEADSSRRARIANVIETLEKRLYLLESGPTGNGPASAVIANATGQFTRLLNANISAATKFMQTPHQFLRPFMR